MLGMNQREGRVFRIALVCHIVLGLGLFFFGIIPSCEEDPEITHVFELAYSPPQPAPPQVRPTPPEPSPKPQVQQPAPKPKPIVKKPTPTPKPAPKQAVQQPQPKKISFDQFRKDHALPPPKQTPLNPSPVKIKINPNDFKLAPLVVSSPSLNTSNVSPSVINQYLAGVKSRLEQVWQSLLARTELSSGGVAHLGFRIASDGSLLQPVITRSSGNSALDALVLSVARSAGNLGRPPGGSFSSSLEIPFRVN